MDVESRYPLSAMQKSMVIASFRAPTSGVYVLQVVCSFQETVDRIRLHEAWRYVIERHELLRSAIHIQSDGIIQLGRSDIAAQWTEIDWSELSPEQQGQKFDNFVRADWIRGFDFTSGPPHRAVLIRRSDSHYQFLWTCHHALVDRRAIFLVIRDLLQYYDAPASGSHRTSEAPPPFTDHLEWLNRQDWTRAECFWRNYLNAFNDPVRLPFDKGDSSEKSAEDAYSKKTLSLSTQMSIDLGMLAERHHFTINTLVQGAWAILLSRYSGKNDVVFGATRACRHSSVSGSESIVGPLLNTVPLRVPVDPDATVVSWLQGIRAQWIEVRDFEHTPLPLVHRWSGVPSGTKLFDSIMVFEPSSPNSMLRRFMDNRHNRGIEILQRTDSPLTLFSYAEPTFELGIAFDQRRFEPETIERMLGHLQTLLEGMARRPESRLSSLPLITEQERTQILQDWNDTARDYPLQVCAQHFFEEHAQASPEHAALVDGHRTISYEELNAQSNQMARRLSKEGLAVEQLVGILLDRRAEVVVAMLGILKAGGALVLLDPELPPGRLDHILDDTQLSLVITTPELFAQLGQQRLKPIWLLEERIDSGGEAQWNIPPAMFSDNLAYAVYTSGSTGKPKGVLITHRSLVNHTLALGEKHGITSTDRRLQLASISSDVFIAEVFTYLSFGATLVFGPRLTSSSVTEFLRFVDENCITVVGMPGSYWHEWVSTMREGEPVIPRSLRLVISGMEEVHAASLDLWQQKVGAHVRWCNAYGPSETTCTAAIYAASNDETPRVAVPIGKPIANIKIYLFDPALNLVPVGVPGEICIGGEGVGRGYLNQPELTHEKFIPDPLGAHKEARLYRTGDMGVWLADGKIVFLGRVDSQVKIRGHRVEPGEIEDVLSRHPEVGQCVVTAYKEDARDRLAAYLVPRSGSSPAIEDLRAFLCDHLPTHMIPSAFMVLERMPLTATDKIDKQRLPVPEREVISAAYVAPRSPMEQQLAQIWAEILGLPRVGVLDNFFALGGDSLQAVQLVAGIEQRFNHALHLDTLWFDAATVAEQARLIEKCVSLNTQSPVIVLQPRGERCPLFCLHTIGGGNLFHYEPIVKHLGEARPIYGLQARGIEASEEPDSSVETMASYCIAAMRWIQPNGPYVLCGFSSAGVIGHEMSRQLRAEGHEVLLFMLDTVSPRHKRTFKQNMLRWFELIRAGSYREVQERVYFHIFNLLKVPHRRRLEKLGESHRWAIWAFRPRPHPGNVVYFEAEHGPAHTRAPHLEWQGLVDGSFTLERISGTHGSITKEPQVRLLTARIASHIAEFEMDSKAVVSQRHRAGVI
jgi:amino acid adenylation domain-containing protein